MGMDQTARFAESPPEWRVVRDLLTGLGYPVQLRMIDGELAFPDEEPVEPWRELRVAAAEGMVTLRRGPKEVTLVTWGNADERLRQTWNALTWAFAHLAGGTIQSQQGSVDATTFRRTADLPPSLRENAATATEPNP
jgi:hypothetical protein